MEPTPGWLSTQMRPFCASVRVFAIESPTPVSPTPWINTLSARYRRVNTRPRSSAGMPPPVSVTWIRTYSLLSSLWGTLRCRPFQGGAGPLLQQVAQDLMRASRAA